MRTKEKIEESFNRFTFDKCEVKEDEGFFVCTCSMGSFTMSRHISKLILERIEDDHKTIHSVTRIMFIELIDCMLHHGYKIGKFDVYKK